MREHLEYIRFKSMLDPIIHYTLYVTIYDNLTRILQGPSF